MKFSITIPAYKRTYLKEAIDSCLAQTYKDFEIVIINDSSPEDLDSIVKTYSDDRIRYYKNEINCGAVNVVDNWNKCLKYATGDYIICMGDDDRLLPCCLEEYRKLIEQYPGLGVYHAWTEIIDENGDFFKMTEARPVYETVYSLIWHRWNGRLQYIGDFLFNTRMLKNNGGFVKLPLAWGSDDITAMIAAIPYGIANTQCICFCYRMNRLTITSTGNAEKKMDAIMEECRWYKDFLKQEPINEQDKKFWICIQKQFDSHLKRKKLNTITEELTNKSLFRIFFWIKQKKHYQLTNMTILSAFYRTCKNVLCKYI